MQGRILTAAERLQMETAVNDPATPQRMLQRMTIALLATQGVPPIAIARQIGVSETTARLWAQRFRRDGLAGLADLPRPGAPIRFGRAARATICALAQQQPHRLGLPYTDWTLDRLRQHVLEAHGIAVSRTQLYTVLRTARIEWSAAAGEPRRRSEPGHTSLTGYKERSA